MAAQQLIIDQAYAATFAELGSFQKLAERKLAVFSFDAEGERLLSYRQRVQELNRQGVTAICLPRRRWKAMFFDMDSTAVAEESIVELARAAGKAEVVAAITERAMAGELDFEAALRERVKMLHGLSSEVIAAVAAKLTINPGLRELANEARGRGIKLFLVSGGFVPLAQDLGASLGFDGFHANQLAISGDRLTGELRGTIVDAAEKARFLLGACQRLGIPASEVLAVGDGANDLPMLKAAGRALGYRPKEVLLPHLDGALYDDYRALIPSFMD